MTIQLNQDAKSIRISQLEEAMDELNSAKCEVDAENSKLRNLTRAEIIKSFLTRDVEYIIFGLIPALFCFMFITSIISSGWLCRDFGHYVVHELAMPRIQSDILHSLNLNHSFKLWESVLNHKEASLKTGFITTAVIFSVGSINEGLKTKLKDLT